jgi:DNA polymerase-3 subunit gamma/tau
MIESLQKDVQKSNINIVHEPQETKQTPLQTTEVTPAKIEARQENNPVNLSNKEFDELRAKIKDRNYELSLCFNKSIKFVSYEDGILSWESCADEDCKKTLTHGYSAIKQLVREVYGFSTQIKNIPCSKVQEKVQEVPQKKVEEEYYEDESNIDTQHFMQPTMQESQSTSMVEDAEMGGSASCVSNCSETDTSTQEINGTDITQEPMVQKAIELFEAKKVTIQSKI